MATYQGDRPNVLTRYYRAINPRRRKATYGMHVEHNPLAASIRIVRAIRAAIREGR